MSARALIEAVSQQLPEELAELLDAEDYSAEKLQATCDQLGLDCVWNQDRSTVVIGQHVITDANTAWPSVGRLDRFLYDASEEDAIAFGVQIVDFNDDFWSNPGPLFHATQGENVESIQSEGLGQRSATRGMSNRWVGSAVFTSTDYEELFGSGSYGSSIFEIDTVAMKRDGYTPRVDQEPDVAEAAWRDALAWKLGAEDFNTEIEQGMSPNTVIVYGGIPPKYLKLIPSR